MRLIVLSLLLLAIAASGFCEEVVDQNESSTGEEEPKDVIETSDNNQDLSETEVSTTVPETKETVLPQNEVVTPGQAEFPKKKGKAKKFLGKVKKVAKEAYSAVKKGAKKVVSLTVKGAKAIGKGVKNGAKAVVKVVKKGAKAVKNVFKKGETKKRED
ncbi:hypothetical protein GCK32_004181 [Trichostrongylus colubriformis]|uniref:Uncharacterized protein n=1 Tax=Trichostrongylus colubriformis TaxID=6319 RepID=A0AAN8ETE3_TRICO